MRRFIASIRRLSASFSAATLILGALALTGIAGAISESKAQSAENAAQISALEMEIETLQDQITKLKQSDASNWEQVTLWRLEIAELKRQIVDLQSDRGSTEPPTPGGQVAMPDRGVQSWGDVIPTRIFGGPGQYPPTAFRAYGIVAFANHPNGPDRARYEAICQAYLNTLSHSTELPHVPMNQQMVTVWPLTTDTIADALNDDPRGEICAAAIGDYSLITAKTAIKTARKAGLTISGRGPFLLAWAPGNAFDGSGKPVLMADLSLVETFEEAQSWFLKWQDDIEQKPELWRDGFDLAAFRLMGRNWLDRTGKQILEVLGP